jgi:hypothetical protein
MADPIDREPVAPVTPVPPPRRKNWLLRILAVLVLGPILVLGLWIAITMNYTYSTGERAGYVQKFSRKGWLCKTWEGELAMVTIPGTAPEIFSFSVRDEGVAHELESDMGRRVAITYKQHKGVPTSCFGETEYYVSNVRMVDEAPQAPQSPAPPAAAPVVPAPGTSPTPRLR